MSKLKEISQTLNCSSGVLAKGMCVGVAGVLPNGVPVDALYREKLIIGYTL